MNIVTARVLSEGSSLKRLAWAFGCAKKGSEDEAFLRFALLRKVADEFTDEEIRALRATPDYNAEPRPSGGAGKGGQGHE